MHHLRSFQNTQRQPAFAFCSRACEIGIRCHVLHCVCHDGQQHHLPMRSLIQWDNLRTGFPHHRQSRPLSRGLRGSDVVAAGNLDVPARYLTLQTVGMPPRRANALKKRWECAS